MYQYDLNSPVNGYKTGINKLTGVIATSFDELYSEEGGILVTRKPAAQDIEDQHYYRAAVQSILGLGITGVATWIPDAPNSELHLYRYSITAIVEHADEIVVSPFLVHQTSYPSRDSSEQITPVITDEKFIIQRLLPVTTVDTAQVTATKQVTQMSAQGFVRDFVKVGLIQSWYRHGLGIALVMHNCSATEKNLSQFHASLFFQRVLGPDPAVYSEPV